MTSTTEKIAVLIEPSLEAMGYELVRVQLSGGQNQILQVMAERDGGMTVDNCADVSRAISALLDVEDPIAGAYTLEVSSPGIDRPLVRAKDYDRFKGFDAKVETRHAIEGRRRFKGRLDGVDGDEVVVTTQNGEARIPLDDIAKAKLILTDELIAAHGGGAE